VTERVIKTWKESPGHPGAVSNHSRRYNCGAYKQKRRDFSRDRKISRLDARVEAPLRSV
jgi:hypothetical protein